MSFFDDVRTNGAVRRPGNTGVSGYNGGTPPPAVVAGPPPAANTATAPASSGSSLASRYPSIVAAYKTYLGRTPSDAEILGQTGNGTFAQNDHRLLLSANNIQNSKEARGYKPAATTEEGFTRTAENNPGLDPAKWVSGHSSPKYVWQAAQQMFDQRTPEGRAATLAHVQKTNPEYFSGWVIDGDKIRHQSGELHSKFDGYNEFDAWRGSKAGEWGSQWLPTQRNGQAYIDPATQQAAPASTTQSAGGDIPASSPMTLPSSQSPSQSAAPLNQGAGGNQTTQGGGYGVDSGQGFGALMAPWEWEFDYGDFKAPTEADMLADPGYKFRRDQGQKAIERSASAEGSLLGGGTLRALMDFGQGLGSQEYGNVYNRKFGEFADARKSAFDEFSTAYNVFNRNQDVPFNRLAAIAGLGQTSAGQLGNQGQAFAANYGNTAMNGANAQGDYWTQAANAGAAGRIGGANAWNSALTNIGNNASQSYYNWQYRPQNRPPANSPFTFGTPVNVGGLG